MGMTMTEKILAAHAGKKQVEPGELIEAKVDLALANDITAPLSLEEFEKLGAASVFDPDRVVFVLDHFTPNKDILSAENCKTIREFAMKHRITHFYEGGACGIEHALLPEQGLVVPGDLVIGADSHTCTYGALGAFSTGVGSTDLTYGMIMGSLWFKVPESIKFVCTGKWQRWVTGKDLILHIIGLIGVEGARYEAMEFAGDAIEALSMDSRLSIANMAIESGAKNGIFKVDAKTLDYVAGRAKRPYKVFESDPDARYRKVYEIDASSISPGCPSLPAFQRQARGRSKGSRHRPGGDRVVHERQTRGPGDGCGDPERKEGCQRREVHHHSRHAGHLPYGPLAGLFRDLPRRRMHHLAPHVRTLPGRPHGRAREGRAGRLYHEQEFRGKNGTP